jgi:acetylornithine deacetylase/succinyl-diaminopimelate desuccinylase-like protein
MTSHYLRHILGLDSRVPDVVRIDKHDRALFVAAGAGVAEHGGWPQASPVYLIFEGFEEFTAAPGAAASFARCGAHEDLAEPIHVQIL